VGKGNSSLLINFKQSFVSVEVRVSIYHSAENYGFLNGSFEELYKHCHKSNYSLSREELEGKKRKSSQSKNYFEISCL